MTTVGLLKSEKPSFLQNLLKSDDLIIGLSALAVFMLHLIAIRGYGYFRDEFYYLACADHPAFGYVDLPPLSIWLLSLVRWTLGDSVMAIRILPAVGHALVVMMAGLIARAFGGGRFAVFLASLAALAPVGNWSTFHSYSMNFLDILCWQFLIWIVIRIVQTGNSRLWLIFGLIAGLGLENKISILFLGFGVVIGLALTPERKYFKDKNLWLGAAIALLLFLPYILWNWTHDWAMLEFMHNAKTYKMSHVTPLGFLWGQIGYNNPATLIVWLAGLGWLLFHPAGKKYRLFGWMFLAIYILFTIQQAKDYYFAGGYPILFAAGAVIWESWLKNQDGRWLKPVMAMLLIAGTVIFLPFTLPILSTRQSLVYFEKIKLQGTKSENHEMGVLPQHYADMYGWEAMVQTVAKAFAGLTEDEKKSCLIYARNYGQAGAVDQLGKKYGLPKASCAHNNYWLWGPPDWDGKVAIIFGYSRDVADNLDDLNEHFEQVELFTTLNDPYCMPYERVPIFVCRRAKFDLRDVWLRDKHFI